MIKQTNSIMVYMNHLSMKHIYDHYSLQFTCQAHRYTEHEKYLYHHSGDHNLSSDVDAPGILTNLVECLCIGQGNGQTATRSRIVDKDT